MRARYIVGTGLILSALVVISIITYSREAVAYYTVDELYTQAGQPTSSLGAALAGSAMAAKPFQVRGEVDPATVQRDGDGLELRFVLVGREGRLPVVYRGLVPDTFDRAESVTVGGRLAGEALEADELYVQCPSKYEAAPPGSAPHPDYGEGANEYGDGASEYEDGGSRYDYGDGGRAPGDGSSDHDDYGDTERADPGS